MKRLNYVYIFLSVTMLSCEKDPIVTTANDTINQNGTSVIAQGNFVDLGTGHNLSGKAFFVKDNATNTTFLRFEDFSVINGPDVNVYLSKTENFQDVIDLGDLIATNGNMNYEFDNAIDISDYDYVIIWCLQYSVNFGYAKLE